MPTEVFDLTEVATQVVEAVGSIASGIQDLKIIEISQNYYNMYAAQKNYYYSAFRTGIEIPLTILAYNTPERALDYGGRIDGAFNSVGPFAVGSGFVSDVGGWWNRHANMYGDTIDSGITELESDVIKIHLDWANYLLRYEEVYTDTESDIRWQNRLMIHNIGIQQGAAISSALDGSINQYQDNIQDMSSLLASYGNGFAKYAGYKRGLSDVSDSMVHGTVFVRPQEQVRSPQTVQNPPPQFTNTSPRVSGTDRMAY